MRHHHETIVELHPNHIPIMFHHPICTGHAYKSHANIYNQLSFIFHTKPYQTHHFKPIIHSIHASYPNHVKLINHRLWFILPIHNHSIHALKCIISPNIWPTSNNKGTTKQAHFSPSSSLRQKGLAQALSVSPRWGTLAWARKLVPTTVPSCNSHTNAILTTQKAFSSTHSSIQTIKSYNSS